MDAAIDWNLFILIFAQDMGTVNHEIIEYIRCRIIPQSANAVRLERLREIIRDEARLRSVFNEIYNEQIHNRI